MAFLDKNGLTRLWANTLALADTKVPTSRTVNGKPLSTDIELDASDVNADSSGSANTAFNNAKAYTDSQIEELNNDLGERFDDLETAVEGKADASHGDHVIFDSTNKPKMDGTAAFGTSTKVARADHIHPTDTSRASQDEFDAHTSNHAPSNAQANVIESIEVNGTAQTISNKSVNITVPTKTSELTNDKAAGSTLGGVKSGGDVTITDGVITVNDDSHTHDGRYYTETEIDSKVSVLNTAIDGKADSNHGHSIADITNLQTTLDGKANSGHGHTTLQALYTGNGGAQPPSSVGTNGLKCNMMNEFVGATNFSGYADVLMMNAYNWSDVPYATALAIQKTNGVPRAWIAAGGNSSTWSGATELITGNNIGSQSVKFASSAGSDSNGDNIATTYATKDELSEEIVNVDNTLNFILEELDGKASAHSHPYLSSSTKYAGSSSAGGAATSANKLNTNAGDIYTPVYFSNGVPVECTNIHAHSADYTENAMKLEGAPSSTVVINAPDDMLQFNHSLPYSANGMFPATDNSNAIITLNRHDGAYDSQLGFSSNGNLYYRNFLNRIPDETLPWRQILIAGEGCVATGTFAIAEGYNTTASGDYSHAEGWGTTATREGSHAEGHNTIAEALYAHAEGLGTTAQGACSHAEGSYITSLSYQHAQGHYNNTTTAKSGSSSGSGSTGETAFVIGNGTSTSASNALRVEYSGQIYATSSIKSSGRDYAEYFEWQDLNPNSEDRRGYFVTLDGDKIKIAEPNDYILGIVSGQPSVVGNGDEDWRGRYILDEFGAFIREEFEYEEEVWDKETNEKHTVTKTGIKYKENPEYDSTLDYIQREDRPEWDAVGMMGVLSVRDDGTCEVNGYCKVAEGGMATSSETGYRVIKRINDNIVEVIFR